MLFSCWQKDTTTRPYRPYRAVLLFSNTKRRVILRMRSDTFQSACDAASTKNKRMATQTNAVKSLSDEVDFSLSGSKCTVSARFLHGFKTCKGCKSLQNRTKGAETPNSKLAMYRREITVKHNFQKLRESPGVRYESVGRGFQRVGMSTVEAVNRKISWLFCFVSHGCAVAERVRLISRRFKTEKMEFHIDKTSRQVYNRTWKQQGITAKSVRMPLWIETG